MIQITPSPATSGDPQGWLPIDLSTAPDSDPDSIYNSATSSSLTLNKSGTGHDSPAVWNLAELADGLISKAQLEALLARRDLIVAKIDRDRQEYGDDAVFLSDD